MGQVETWSEGRGRDGEWDRWGHGVRGEAKSGTV